MFEVTKKLLNFYTPPEFTLKSPFCSKMQEGVKCFHAEIHPVLNWLAKHQLGYQGLMLTFICQKQKFGAVAFLGNILLCSMIITFIYLEEGAEWGWIILLGLRII